MLLRQSWVLWLEVLGLSCSWYHLCRRSSYWLVQVMVEDADAVSRRLKHYGGLFIGSASAEVRGW